MAQIHASTLPSTHRALRQDERFKPLSVQSVPVPAVIPGSAVLRVHAAGVISYMKEIYNGERNYPYPVPITAGSAAIARVVALGPDATRLKVGDLCLLDITVRSRDGKGDIYLNAITDGFTPGSKKLMAEGGFRDGTYAEYVRFPLENCYRLDERRLLGPLDQGGLGYEIEDLMYVNRMLVPYGGMGPLCIDVKPGETVVVAPATGAFGSAAVHVALELGAAKVIAMGRNTSVLERVKALEPDDKKWRVVTVPLTGVLEKDLKALTEAKDGGEIDAFFDISPPMAKDSAHIKAGVLSLRHGGRLCLMGGLKDDVALPHLVVMHFDLTIKGKWMYEREDVTSFIKLVESGTVRLHNDKRGWKMYGSQCTKKYRLEDWADAFDEAQTLSGGGSVVFEP
jgi:NADPH:quinone reductase-like Zn-dependent oxidoreductase